MKISFPLKTRLSIFSHPAMGMLPGVWFYLLRSYGFHWTIFPKICCISVIVVLNYPFALIERAIYKSKLRRIVIREPVFILGHPRSGTTLLHYLLAQDDRFVTPDTLQCILPNTFLTTGFVFRPLFKALMPDSRPMDDMAMGPGHPKEEEFGLINMNPVSFAAGYYFPNNLSEIYRKTVLFEDGENAAAKWKKALKTFVRKITIKKPGRTVLLKSPYNTVRIKSILDIFPDARFIHLHRDPAEVYYSNLKLMERVIPLLTLQKPKGSKVRDFIEMSYLDFQKKFLKEKNLIGDDRFFELKFDHLVSQPVEELNKLYNHFHWNSFEEARPKFELYLEQNANHQKGAYPDREKVLKSLGPEWESISRELGYS